MKKDYDPNLAESLGELPIEVGKVLLWLVYRGLKPMASIVLTFDWGTKPVLERKLEYWFDKAGIKYMQSQRFANTLHVSQDPRILNTNRKHELSETSEAHEIRGKLYGFPEAAARQYSLEIVKEKPFPSSKIIHPPRVSALRKKYWYPYVEYLLRRGHELEDSLAAKFWARLARKEIPGIAIEYEKDRLRDLKKQQEQLTKIYAQA